MHRVPSSTIASTIVAVVFLAVQWTETQAEAQTSPQSSETETLQAVTLVFGYYDEEPSPWDGSVSISAGAITKIRPHHFRQEDKISNKDNSWQVSTKPWPNRLFSAHLHPREFPRPILNAVRPIGITIEYRGPETAVMQIKLKEPRKLPGVTFGVSDEQAESFGMKAQADQFQLRLHDLPESGWLQLLNGRILAFRVPPVEQITKSEYEDDYPSVHVDQTGNMWVAWIGYRDKEDEVLVRRRHEGAWSEPMTVSDSPGDHFSTDMAMDATGRLWVVWSQREDSDWHLMARAYDGTKWGPIEQLTHGAGNNIFHRITSDSEGTLHVVWQGSRGGRFDILSKSLKGNRWTDEIALSDPDRPQRANDWMPAVAADRSGTV